MSGRTRPFGVSIRGLGDVRTNNAADEPPQVRGGMSTSSTVPPSKSSVINLPERMSRPRFAIRVHWGLLFAVGASLALWLIIWACIRLFF